MAAVDPYDPLTNAPQLEPVIERCLAKAPEHRYQSIAELAAALVPFARDPNRAQHYVARAQRMASRTVAPTPIHDVASRPISIPKPPGAAPNLGGEPGTLSGDTGTLTKRSRTGLVIGLAVTVAIAGVAVTAVAMSQTAKPAATKKEGERYTMEAVSPALPDAGVDATAIAIAVDASTPVAVVVDAGSGSAKKPIKRVVKKAGAGSATTAKGSGSAAPPPPPVDAGSAVKKCNVWESRTGCR